MKYFLLVYDRPKGQLLDGSPIEFSDEDRDKASHERFRLEKVYRDNTDIEVVLLGSDSLETIKRTHGRYFMTLESLAEESTQALHRAIESARAVAKIPPAQSGSRPAK